MPNTKLLNTKAQRHKGAEVYTLVLLIAAFFSFLALGNAQRFHPDEAYYMTSARHAAVNGDWWLLAEPVDKPPLTFYLNALALVCCAVENDANGVLQLDALKGEFAGRFPSLLLSILLVAIVMKLAKTLSKSDKAAYIAGFLVALSPLRIVFAATAFTDMPMLCFGALSLLMAARGKAGWAGFWFMVSFAAKPQAVFYLPLVLYFIARGRNILRPYKGYIPTIRFVLALLLGAGILRLWDAARMGQGAQSIWVLGQARYTATSFTVLQDYPARFAEFWATIQYGFGYGVITAGLFLLVLFHLFCSGRPHGVSPTTMALYLWLSGFVAVHLVLTLNLFDRNLIVVLPVMVIVVSEALNRMGVNFRIERKTPNPQPLPPNSGEGELNLSKWIGDFKKFSFLAIPLLSIFAFQAAWADLPIGGDDGRHDGINELADYMNSKAVATVIYDTWLDWELDYYMGQWTDKRRVFYPNVELLLRDALTLDEAESRYFIVPIWIDESAWLVRLRESGFTVNLDREFENFRVWEVIPD